jgi:DNA repair exonuclease SbcCD nuclease subunit
MSETLVRDGQVTAAEGDVVLVHSSDIHVDDGLVPDIYEGDAAGGLRAVLAAGRALGAQIALLVGDVFDHNRIPPDLLLRSTELLAEAGMDVVILPGNHDPLTPDSVYRRSGIADLAHVRVLGLTHEDSVHFHGCDLEIWGHAHHSYDNMVPLRTPRARSTRWQIALAHGHYEPDGSVPLRPSWLISDGEIDATGADYLALGHWNRPVQVGTGSVPAYYSGSPDLARTVNLIRLTGNGTVTVTREPLRFDLVS